MKLLSIPSHRILFQKAFGTPTVSLGHSKREPKQNTGISRVTQNNETKAGKTANVVEIVPLNTM